MRPLWFVKLLRKTFPHRFLVAHFTRIPLIGRLMDRLMFRDDTIYYLPKDNVVSVSIEQSIPHQENFVIPSQLLQKFINEANHLWIMNECICRRSEGCKDYPKDIGCLFLGKATLNINPKLGRSVSRQEALVHIRRAQEAGLVHLVGRNRLDMLWLGATPGDQLMSICNCCPCCCLWKVLPHVAGAISDNVSQIPGLQIEVTDACVGCGRCTENVCFVEAISVQNGKAVISEECRGCGRCANVCPQSAIHVALSTAHLKQAYSTLSKLVDVK